MTTAGDRILKSVEQALAFAKGERDHGCIVHIPEQVEDIDYSDTGYPPRSTENF